MKKLSELLVDGVTLNDVMNSTLDGYTMTGDFSVRNKGDVKVDDLRVRYTLTGVTFATLMADASKTVVIRGQRPARELSEAELTRVFDKGNPLVRHYSEAGTKIETPEQVKARRVAMFAAMSEEERAEMLELLQG